MGFVVLAFGELYDVKGRGRLMRRHKRRENG